MIFRGGLAELACGDCRKERVSLKVSGDLREIQHLCQRQRLGIDSCAAADEDLGRFCGGEGGGQVGKGTQMCAVKLLRPGEDKAFPMGQRRADLLIGAPPENDGIPQGQLPKAPLLAGNVPGDPPVPADGAAAVEGGDQGDMLHRTVSRSIRTSPRIMEAPIWIPNTARMFQPLTPPSCRSLIRRMAGETSS